MTREKLINSKQSSLRGWRKFHFKNRMFYLRNEFWRRKFMISLWFSISIGACGKFENKFWINFRPVVPFLQYHAHVSRESDPWGLQQPTWKWKNREKLCNIYRQNPLRVVDAVVDGIQHPLTYVITFEKIISHLALSSSFVDVDNLSKIFTSCLIKASEIRASGGKDICRAREKRF